MIIKRITAYILLFNIYFFTLLVAIIGGIIPRRRWKPTGRIAVTGTFFNPNWYLSHVTPLARSGVKEVILVVDEPQMPMDNVTFVCPPKWVAKILSRAGAKAIWMLLAGLRYKPDLYMGYHIAPGACSALVAGRIFGRPSCYQMTGGPAEVIGGGIDASESVGGSLGRPSKLIESLAIHVIRKFDLIVVRGSKARDYLKDQKVKGTIAIITGSVKEHQKLSQSDRTYDLINVGQLVPRKQVEQFVTIVHLTSQQLPKIKAAVVGDGPLLEDLKAQAAQLGLSDKIEFLGKRKDVEAILGSSKVFVMNSKLEGLAIAMMEAMAAGAVPVVADVGDLSDLVNDGVNGYLIEPNNIDRYIERIIPILQDQSLKEKLSLKSIEDAKNNCYINVISGRWQHNLQETIRRAPKVII
ncbi:MAG: glycosyltransferase family 4 protein [Sedimentisphaerales bacterium]|nr:glycosyltransferase family 4 protein [Sedimentisphaerales bacterium]